MKALILAAGVARRLYPLTFDKPKCLLKVGRNAIIDYQLDSIKSHQITDVTVVVGYFREQIVSHLERRFPGINFNFITNEHFFETNTAYSLYLCRNLLQTSEVLLMNGDVLYPEELLRRVLFSDRANVLAVEMKPCGREEVKVIAGADSRIVAIGKELIQENALGEFIGVAKFSRGFDRMLVNSLDRLIAAGGKADYFEAAIHPLLAETGVFYEDVSDLPCIEIDYVEDLERAAELVRSEWFGDQF